MELSENLLSSLRISPSKCVSDNNPLLTQFDMGIFQKLYVMCCILRVVLVFIPQTGYIHPDEFFQSMEVATGETFDVKHKLTWEFNSRMPIRSWAPIFLFVKLPLTLLHRLTSFTSYYPSPYLILIMSRLVTAILSFVNDLFVYLLAKRVHVSHVFMALFFYGFSYTTLVHMTHTLSNSWEATLLSLIGILALQSLRNNNDDLLISTSTNCVIFIVEGVVLACAFFCRPTVLLFTAPYLIAQLYFLSSNLKCSILYCIVVPLSFVTTSLALIYFDSEHYHPESVSLSVSSLTACFASWKEMSACIFSNKLSVTPLNFLLYNLNSDNLSQHGRHSWYTHFLINMPQLFGPFYFLCLIAPVVLLLRRTTKEPTSKEYNFQIVQRKSYYLVLCCALVPLICLSFFCHQEARFLLPLATLWSILSAIAFQHYTLSQSNATSASRRSFHLLSFWVAFNLLGVVFYGFLHQGGIVKCLLQLYYPLHTGTSCSAVVFYRTYMPPQSLLMLPPQIHHHPSNSHLQFACNEVHDLAGTHEVVAIDYIIDLLGKMRSSSENRQKFLYLTFPYSGVPDFALTNSSLESLFDGEYDSVFENVGHFSGEYPPDLYPHSWPNIMQVWYDWKKQLSLVTYRFKVL